MITITEINDNIIDIIWLSIKVLAINIVISYFLKLILGFEIYWYMIPMLILEFICAVHILRTPLFIDYEEAALEMVENAENMQSELDKHKTNFEIVKTDYEKAKSKYVNLQTELTKLKTEHEDVKTDLEQIDLLQNQITNLQNQNTEQKKQFENWAEQLRNERNEIKKYQNAIQFIENEFNEGKEISILLLNRNIPDLDIALKKLRGAINHKLNK